MRTELKVMSARAVKMPVSAVAAEFSAANECAIQFDFSPVGTLESKIAAGEIADLIILSQPAIAKMEQAGALVAGSVRALGRMRIGVCVRDSVAKPDLSTPEAFRALLVSARAISVSDPSIGGTSAVYLPKLFEHIGMTAELEPKLRRQKGGGGDVAECVAHGEADIGITFISEMLPIAGVVVAGPLPDVYGNDTTYCAGVPLAGRAPQIAQAFGKTLTLPLWQPVWTSAGFAPV